MAVNLHVFDDLQSKIFQHLIYPELLTLIQALAAYLLME